MALGGLFSAIAQGRVAAGSINILAKKPDDWSKGMVLCITVEFYAILSLLASMLMIIRPGPRRTKETCRNPDQGTEGRRRAAGTAELRRPDGKRKLALAAKQEVLGEAFDLALDKLCSLPEEDYIALLTRLAVGPLKPGRSS